MTRFLLVRHTAHDYLTKGIAGRKPGVNLNARGTQQAEQLAEKLSCLPIKAIFSGPLERVRATAQPLADRLGLEVEIAPEFDEIEVGDWTGRSFAELQPLPEWQIWNHFRSGAAPPRGESMLEVQRRAAGKILQLKNTQELIAIFSHGDVIRAVLIFFLGMPIDLYARLQIDPGGISVLELHNDSAVVCSINSGEALSPIVGL